MLSDRPAPAWIPLLCVLLPWATAAPSPLPEGARGFTSLAELERALEEEAEQAARAAREKRLKALASYLKARPQAPDRGDALVRAAELALDLGHAADAAAHARSYQKDFPSGPERAKARHVEGLALLSLPGRTDEAQEALEGALEAQPSGGETVFETIEALAGLHLDAGRKKEAKEVYARLEKLYGKQASNLVKSLSEGADLVGTAPKPLDAKDLEGKDLTWDRFKGKVVLLDFWATWCGPCLAELPNVMAVHRKYHDKGFEVVGISLDQEREALDRFLKGKAVPWPQHFDGKGWENEVASRWGIRSIPATYLVSPEGKILRVGLRGRALERAVGGLLAGGQSKR